MEGLYDNLADYYVFDKSKYTLEEFFTDLKAFKDCFYVSIEHFAFIIKKKKNEKLIHMIAEIL